MCFQVKLNDTWRSNVSTDGYLVLNDRQLSQQVSVSSKTASFPVLTHPYIHSITSMPGPKVEKSDQHQTLSGLLLQHWHKAEVAMFPMLENSAIVAHDLEHRLYTTFTYRDHCTPTDLKLL